MNINNLKKLLFLNIATILLLAVSFIGYSGYLTASGLIILSVDDRLIAGANAVISMLGDEFHSRIADEKSISEEEHMKNVMKLSSFASKNGLEYIYSMMKSGDRFVFTSSSATREELDKKTFDKFYKPYDTTSETLLKAFNEATVNFEEFQDEYGYFRSVMIPVKLPDGRVYLAGADISISAITEKTDRILKEIVIKMSMIFLICALFIYLIINLVFKRIEILNAPKASETAK
ncbi:MAG TPA: hypothetical protein PKK26_03625 [Candidatus Wallbacteria bacterium]|nr:hypothetical protein [Candidatus Wallbacteria bacterium]